MISLNLLPEVKIEYLRTKRLQARVISGAILAGIIAVGLVVLMAVWVYGAQTIQKAYFTGEIKKNNNELQAIPDIDKYLTIQNQLASLTTLHEGKSDFSRLLSFLPSLNPAAPRNVTLTNVTLKTDDAGNLLTLQGETKDYTGLNTFRDTLLNATLKYGTVSERLFESVVITTSSLEKGQAGEDVVTFNIDTSYNPNAFLYSVKNPSVTVPKLNTTQSVQSAPDVFGQSSVQKENE